MTVNKPDVDKDAEMKRHLQWLDHSWNEYLDKEYAQLRSEIGSAIDEYRGSRDSAVAATQNIDFNHRRAALFVLNTAYGNDAEIAKTCRELIATELDEEVKILAMGYLSRYGRNSCDMDLAQMFANIVLCEAESIVVRKVAYSSLILVFSGPLVSPRKWIDNRFPEDVNWRWVKRLAKRQPHWWRFLG